MAFPLFAMLAAATIMDFRYRCIPNALSLGAAVIGLSMQGALLGPAGVVLGALGWTVALLCFLPFYAAGGMAAGDVKLMAGAAAFLGPVDAVLACIAVLIAGGLLAAGYVAVQRVASRLTTRLPAEVGPVSTSATEQPPAGLGKVPYAAAIAVGTMAVVLEPPFLMALLPIGVWS